jgi:EAL domain-containing protein (putative c-di-GMP-specific phosphodiesterase class I)/AmiR/NasT family two-component response regulator
LVVDDDPVVRAMTVSVLRRAGFATVEADSGESALAALADTALDAVLLDQVMPGMTGIELTDAVRALPAHRMTPILFLSANADSEVRIAALRAGATDFMTKPVVLNELVARVGAQLRVTADWRSMVGGLQRRAATVSELAGVGGELNPTMAARVICERISLAHGRVGVGIYSCADEACVLLSSAGERPRLVEDTLDADRTIVAQAEGGPWIHHDPNPSDIGERSGWWACAPLRRGSIPLGVLMIRGEQAAGTSSADQLLAAAVDYATTVALHLGGALSGTRRMRQHRQALRRILAERTFAPLFQPIVDLGDGGVVGYEALTRFGDGEPVSQRLVDANEAGMRPQFELALLAAALPQTSQLGPGLWMSVNLSPSVLVWHTEELADVIATASAPVVVELTENERIDDYAAVRAALGRLGPTVRLSVDDTGAGYASLRHVVDLRPDYLKLDRSWISGLERDGTRQALVAGLVGFCQHTGTDLIAEGVETPGERAALEGLSVRYAQGYLLGRPGLLPDPVAPPTAADPSGRSGPERSSAPDDGNRLAP